MTEVSPVIKKEMGKGRSIALALLVAVLLISNVWTYASLQNQINTLNNERNNLQRQVNSLQLQYNTLNATYQNYKSTHGFTNTQYISQITTLQGQITSLENDKIQLQADNQILRQNITNLQRKIAELEAGYYTAGSILATLSGGYENKTGLPFYIPAGHIRIVVELTSLGSIRTFYSYLYEVGQSRQTWYGYTENPGTWTNYVYSLKAGDYYLKVGSVNFNWQITVYVYK